MYLDHAGINDEAIEIAEDRRQHADVVGRVCFAADYGAVQACFCKLWSMGMSSLRSIGWPE